MNSIVPKSKRIIAENSSLEDDRLRMDAMGTAAANRLDPSIPLTGASKLFAHLSPLAMAEICCEIAGRLPMNPDRGSIVANALHTSSDFPLLLGDVANKLLMPRYEAAKPTYRLIAARRNFKDFKAHRFLRVDEFPELLQVGEGGEIKHGTITEDGETIRAYTYGRQLRVSRQMLINDNLDAFADVIKGIASMAARLENYLAWSVLNANGGLGPVMSDGFNLFDDTNHGNYTSSGTAISVLELGKLSAKMQKQESDSGMKLNIRPAVLATSPDSENAALQATTQTTPAQASNVTPQWMTALTVAGEAEATSTQYGWYLFANPNDVPALIWGSLPGQEGPMVATQQGWDVSGVAIKVERDFACGVAPGGYKGVAFNAGAAPV